MKRELTRAFNLPDTDRHALAQALHPVALPRSPDHEVWVRQVQEIFTRTLPAELRNALYEMRCAPNPPGVIILNNMPVDALLPPTPQNGHWAPDAGTRVAESCVLGVSSLLGEPFGFAAEKASLVHHVVPVRSAASELSNQGKVELPWHTELAGLPHRPHFLILFGLRSDHSRQAYTRVADVRPALERLSRRDRAELRKAQFRSRLPVPYLRTAKDEAARWSAPHAVIVGDDNSPEARAATYGGSTQADSAAGERALEGLSAAMDKVEQAVLLDRGVMVIVNNAVAMHKRTAYEPRYDGTDRWFLRTYIADSLWPFREHQTESIRLLSL